MRIIQPEAHILPQNGDILQHVERCGRVAYKSENAITDTSYLNFISRILASGHESVLEHGNYIFDLMDADVDELLNIYSELIFDFDAADALSARLRFTAHSGRNLVSGNIRAWRDFIKVANRCHYVMPEWLNNAFCHNPAFADLGLSKDYIFGTEISLNGADLLPEEQEYHRTVTAYFICSRAISHELVRHRALSPTQESQRYCNYSKDKFGGGVTFIEPLWAANDELQKRLWGNVMEMLEDSYLGLLGVGRQPQEAREVLPNSTKTELVVTGTVAEWKHFFDLRCADDAHPEMRRLAIPLREEFKNAGLI